MRLSSDILHRARDRTKARGFLLLASLAFLAFPALAFAQSPARELAWPRPPQAAKIRHLRTIASPKDLGVEEGFLGKALRWLFGGEEEAYGWFAHPVGIAVARDRTIYIADPGGKCVHVLNLARGSSARITRTASGELRSPVGVACAADGRVYVSDSERGEILEYDASQQPAGSFLTPGCRPIGISWTADGLYVADGKNHCVHLFDGHGARIASFGSRGNGNGQFNFPVQVHADSTLYVVDAMNFRIQAFDRAGRYLASFGGAGSSAGSFANPKSVALDSERHVYVTDALMDNVQIFAPDGKLLLIFGSHGSADGEFLSPSGIAIDDDVIYVVDSLNKRLQLFSYLK